MYNLERRIERDKVEVVANKFCAAFPSVEFLVWKLRRKDGGTNKFLQTKNRQSYHKQKFRIKN